VVLYYNKTVSDTNQCGSMWINVDQCGSMWILVFCWSKENEFNVPYEPH